MNALALGTIVEMDDNEKILYKINSPSKQFDIRRRSSIISFVTAPIVSSNSYESLIRIFSVVRF